MSDVPVRAYGVPEAAKLASVGRSTLYRAINDGELIARKRGRRTFILSEDLTAWLRASPKLKDIDNPPKA